MSLGQHQFLGSLGGTMLPYIGDHEFKMAVRKYGKKLIIKRKVGSNDCICFDPNFQSYAPDCELCNGTGSAAKWNTSIIWGIIFFKAERIQGYHQTLYTKAGQMKTFDASAFVSGDYWNPEEALENRKSIRSDDGLIFDKMEFRIVSLLPRYASKKTPIFLRLDLERHPYTLTNGDVNEKL